MSQPNLLEARSLVKRFGHSVAVSNVDFVLEPGSIHGLLGGNGAGKSTLISMLSGAAGRDDGTIAIAGREVGNPTPSLMKSLGIRTIYQNLDLVETLSVEENLVVGEYPAGPGGIIRWRGVRRHYEELAARFPAGTFPPPEPRVGDLSIRDRYLVAIGRALAGRAVILIMDEPTAGLDEADAAFVYSIIRELRTAGLGIVLVTHDLIDAIRVCDTLTVLQDGRVVSAGPTGRYTTQELAALIGTRGTTQDGDGSPSPRRAGRGPDDRGSSPASAGLQIDVTRAGRRLRDIRFQLAPGEVLGVVGLVGSGRTTLLETIYGAHPEAEVVVRLDGRRIRLRSPADAIGAGICLVPSDRKNKGLFPGSVVENIGMLAVPRPPIRSAAGLLRKRQESEVAESLVRRFGVALADMKQSILQLSGGNQQKVLVARASSINPTVWLLDSPTAGLDVGAQATIVQVVRRLADAGSIVLVADEELEFLKAVCDRFITLRHGRCAWAGPSPLPFDSVSEATHV